MKYKQIPDDFEKLPKFKKLLKNKNDELGILKDTKKVVENQNDHFALCTQVSHFCVKFICDLKIAKHLPLNK